MLMEIVEISNMIWNIK